MSDIDLTHRCSEPKCVSFGQATHPSGCLCHMTQVEMAKERIADLKEALAIIVANARTIPDPDMAGTTDIAGVPLDDIETARAAMARANGEHQPTEPS